MQIKACAGHVLHRALVVVMDIKLTKSQDLDD